MKPNLLIRSDASAEIGVGHVMRCLALAQAWQGLGGKAFFATTSMPETVRARLKREACEVVLLPASREIAAAVELAEQVQACHVVLDGRQFQSADQRRLKEAGLHVLVIDDYGRSAPYWADCVVNPDIVGEEMYADRAPYTKLLLGPKYALLRKEFVSPQKLRRADGFCNLLVTMGGSDPENMTLSVVRAIHHLPKTRLRVRVVVGGANPRLDLLRREVAGLGARAEVLDDVTDMPDQMKWADITVTAAGVTLWELLYMGTAVICWPRYEEDIRVVAELNKMGAVLPLPVHADATAIASLLVPLMEDSELRERMCSAGQAVVDGEGARRVVEAFSSLPGVRLEEGRTH